MLQVLVVWNLSRPDQQMADTVENVKLRGYNPDAFLTGEFARKVKLKLELNQKREQESISEREYNREVVKQQATSPLSVSSIADKYCPTRRDLYFTKGINRPSIQDKITWGRVAGYVVEDCILEMLGESIECNRYSSIISESDKFSKNFQLSHQDRIRKLEQMEKTETRTEIGDTDWLLRLMDNNGRAEFGLKILHSLLNENRCLDVDSIEPNPEICPNITEIGINSPAVPDFIIPQFGIVGDIKTGVEFMPHHQLTCAGYAVARENELGKDNNINWGIVYFFPTRNPSAYVRPLTFAQVYIFPIDDNLRGWFLRTRNKAYNLISKLAPPDLPDERRREHCSSCRFAAHCKVEASIT